MTNRPHADVAIVGLGWSGSLMAEELTRAGLTVVALERGDWRDTTENFPPSISPDELRFAIRRELMQPPAVETMTFRNQASQTALPLRDWNTYQFGWNVGGAGTHWNGMIWRYLPTDFRLRSHIAERYGEAKIPSELSVQDWGVTYEDLEPFYDRFERLAGASGYAGNIGGTKRPGGNIFEGARSRDYPLPPLERTQATLLFDRATRELGYNPFPVPAGNTSGAYTNPLGVRMAPCTYCGYCAFYGCGNWSKASPQACILPSLMQRENFSIITRATVLRAELSPDRHTARGVTFVDDQGQEGFQPADIVIFAAYQFDNVRLMLLSGIGTPYDGDTHTGVVGRNYSYQTITGASLFLDGQNLNPFIGAGALAQSIDDFNGDNFDHANLDFIGGSSMLIHSATGAPIGMADALPSGTPRWGAGWKEGFTKAYQNGNSIYCMGNSHSTPAAFLDLDPTYRDRHGQPLLRVTFDWNDNDKRLGRFIADRSEMIGRAMGASSITRQEHTARPFSPMDNLSSHTAGGAVMGDDPGTSAVNRYLQSWDVHNVFVVGASAFPQNGGYNPTGTVAALTLHAAEAIRTQYLPAPGPMVAR